MPRVCTICTHPDREAIDVALARGQTVRATSAQYRVSEDALGRHKADHLPAHVLAEVEAAEVEAVDDLLGQVRDLHRRTLAILTVAEADGKLAVALSAIREARGNLELLAKLEGKIREQQTVNVLIAPAWVELRAVILATLAPYPEARAALATALLEAERVSA